MGCPLTHTPPPLYSHSPLLIPQSYQVSLFMLPSSCRISAKTVWNCDWSSWGGGEESESEVVMEERGREGVVEVWRLRWGACVDGLIHGGHISITGGENVLARCLSHDFLPPMLAAHPIRVALLQANASFVEANREHNGSYFLACPPFRRPGFVYDGPLVDDMPRLSSKPSIRGPHTHTHTQPNGPATQSLQEGWAEGQRTATRMPLPSPPLSSPQGPPPPQIPPPATVIRRASLIRPGAVSRPDLTHPPLPPPHPSAETS